MNPAANLFEALEHTARTHPRNGFTFANRQGQERYCSYEELLNTTARWAAGLHALGLRRGDRIALALTEPEEFVLAFFGAVRAGIVPVPLSPPYYLGDLGSYLEQSTATLRSCGATVLASSSVLRRILVPLIDSVPALERVIPVESIPIETQGFPLVSIDATDLAFLQYTSGSTKTPRGVAVTHRSLLCNADVIMGAGLEMDPDKDRGCSWLPLYHDMGLVGFVLSPIVWGVSVTLMPTLSFIKNPAVWFDSIHRHRATVTFAPNFAYALALRLAGRMDISRWEISCVKAFGCGAEPIRPEVMREFTRVYGERCGLRPQAVLPAYGLAESTLAVTMKRLSDPVCYRSVDREEHVCCGRVLPGYELRIADPDGLPRDEGVQGEIWLRGPSVASGYFQDPDATRDMWHEGWLRTGDLGYLEGRDLYVTGRIKDIVIINGRNHHPEPIEWAVGAVEGIRQGGVAAFSRPGAGGEELVIVAETRSADRVKLAQEVTRAVQKIVLSEPVDIMFVQPGDLPKTSSGKLQRHRLRQSYLEGRMTRLRSEGGLNESTRR